MTRRSFFANLTLGFLASLLLSLASPNENQHTGKEALPHIVFLLIDDFGWAEASWHRAPGYKEVQSPRMQALLEDGIELDRNYAFKFCSPTRSAIQSGRNPIHVNAQNLQMMMWDPANPLTGVSGIPVNMTGLAQRMAEAGYKHRVFSGKWDAGMAYQRQTPEGRGYTDTLYYFQHMNDYWSLNVGKCGNTSDPIWTRDLFGSNPDGTFGPQFAKLNPPHCWVQNMSAAENPVAPFPSNMTSCVYEEDMFTDYTVEHILAHNTTRDGPLLAFHSSHSIHTPLEVVPESYNRFDFIDYHDRRTYHAMVYTVDRAIGRIVDALKKNNMYNNTLIVLSSDNGGPIYMNGRGGANNYPLKGGKAGNWEGGIRVNGFVSGGAVPVKMRGTKLTGLITAWDWYATFIEGIAGLKASDQEAQAAGLPPIDSINQWPYLSGQTSNPPRTDLPVGSTRDATDVWAHNNDICVQSLLQANYSDSTHPKLFKLLLGASPQAIWTGPQYPNQTTANQTPAEEVFFDCGFDSGCLFELFSDPSERADIAALNPDIVSSMRQQLEAVNRTVFAPKRPDANGMACEVSLSKYKDPRYEFGWWGPFAE